MGASAPLPQLAFWVCHGDILCQAQGTSGLRLSAGMRGNGHLEDLGKAVDSLSLGSSADLESGPAWPSMW